MRGSGSTVQFNIIVSWRGTWSVSTTYSPGDAVFYEGSTYLVLTTSTGGNTPATNPNYTLLAQGGAGGISLPIEDLNIDDTSSKDRDLSWFSSAVKRWVLRVTGEPETGANSGSNFQLERYSDDGIDVSEVLKVVRATGEIIVSSALIHFKQAGIRVGDDLRDTDVNIDIRAVPSRRREIVFRSGNATRWKMGATADPETGSDVGSTFAIEGFSDSGTSRGRNFEIRRQDGQIKTSGELIVGTKAKVSKEVEIGGSLIHRGLTVGFFEKEPVTQRPDSVNTSGATLGALETEVNKIKQVLRDYGFMLSGAAPPPPTGDAFYVGDSEVGGEEYVGGAT